MEDKGEPRFPYSIFIPIVITIIVGAVVTPQIKYEKRDPLEVPKAYVEVEQGSFKAAFEGLALEAIKDAKSDVVYVGIKGTLAGSTTWRLYKKQLDGFFKEHKPPVDVMLKIDHTRTIEGTQEKRVEPLIHGSFHLNERAILVPLDQEKLVIDGKNYSVEDGKRKSI